MNGWLNLILYELLSYLLSPLFLSLLLHGSFLQQCCSLDSVQLLVHPPDVVPLLQEVKQVVLHVYDAFPPVASFIPLALIQQQL